jgi:hypothetical protein
MEAFLFHSNLGMKNWVREKLIRKQRGVKRKLSKREAELAIRSHGREDGRKPDAAPRYQYLGAF